MSGGDFLFIFSFIVLPTAILVSAIWALIALRAGVLLPPRRVVDQEYGAWAEDEAFQGRDAEHPASEQTLPIAVSRGDGMSSQSPEAVAIDVSSPLETGEPRTEPVASGEPPVEQTLEMDAVEAAPVAATTTTEDDVSPVIETASASGVHDEAVGKPVAAESLDVASVPPVVAAGPVPDDLDIVFVPSSRHETSDSTDAPASDSTPPELPEGTEPMAVERPDAVDLNGDVAEGKLDLEARIPNEATAIDEDSLPAHRNGVHRRGPRLATRPGLTGDLERRKRLLVSTPARRGGGGRREDESASVSQHEGPV